MFDYQYEWTEKGYRKSKIETITMDITPDIAKQMLEHRNPNNRIPNEKRITMYAESMRNGNWIEEANGVQFDENGMLIDGHHRLMAIVQANCTVPMRVSFDCPTESVIHIDDNQPRSVAQRNKMIGNDIGSKTNVIAFVKFFLSKSNRPVDIDEINGAIKEHSKVVQMIVEHCMARHNKMHSNVAGMLMKMIIEDKISYEDMIRFSDVYCLDKVSEQRDQTILKIRKNIKKIRPNQYYQVDAWLEESIQVWQKGNTRLKKFPID